MPQVRSVGRGIAHSIALAIARKRASAAQRHTVGGTAYHSYQGARHLLRRKRLRRGASHKNVSWQWPKASHARSSDPASPN